MCERFGCSCACHEEALEMDDDEFSFPDIMENDDDEECY